LQEASNVGESRRKGGRWMMDTDPYDLLGITRGASLEEVRAAYHKAVLTYHPDAFDGDTQEAERRFRKIVEAYETVLRQLPSSEVERKRAVSPADMARKEMAHSLAGAALSPRRRFVDRRRVFRAIVTVLFITYAGWGLRTLDGVEAYWGCVVEEHRGDPSPKGHEAVAEAASDLWAFLVSGMLVPAVLYVVIMSRLEKIGKEQRW
jgi:hypothetical protein